MATIHEVIIIGSGPAGHTAAIYAARANLRPLMFEGFVVGGSPGGQLITTTEVENYPGFPQGITGPELMTAMRQQSERFGTVYVTQDVDAVDFSQRPFKITSQKADHFADAVIVATGASARYLGLESEKRLMNAGVSACATCDGALPLFRNRDLVVVGGGDSAMEEALFLTRFASKVILVHRREQFRASKIMFSRVEKHAKIEILAPFVVDEILGGDQVEGIRLRHRQTDVSHTREVAGVFMAIGHTPNTQVFVGHLDLDDAGYIKTRDGSTYTSVAGVFACGDVQDRVYRQAVTAAGSGCQAAIDVERWLEARKS